MGPCINTKSFCATLLKFFVKMSPNHHPSTTMLDNRNDLGFFCYTTVFTSKGFSDVLCFCLDAKLQIRLFLWYYTLSLNSLKDCRYGNLILSYHISTLFVSCCSATFVLSSFECTSVEDVGQGRGQDFRGTGARSRKRAAKTLFLSFKQYRNKAKC